MRLIAISVGIVVLGLLFVHAFGGSSIRVPFGCAWGLQTLGPGRQTAVEAYEDCVARTDPALAQALMQRRAAGR